MSDDTTTTSQEISPDAAVSLREITKDTVRTVIGLKVAPGQEHFVASNAFSIAEAHFSDIAWFRAIYAGETPVGFIMLADDPDKHEYFLWRLMIDARQQGKGYGCRAVQQLIDYVKTRPGATELLVSYVPGEGSPRDFYVKLGFQDTGRIEDDEIVLRLPLESSASQA
ncbi:MAG TPA: GNAT family N-acetyltransferase [Ktedonobacterales bacterium]